jgi:hypothetical protein
MAAISRVFVGSLGNEIVNEFNAFHAMKAEQFRHTTAKMTASVTLNKMVAEKENKDFNEKQKLLLEVQYKTYRQEFDNRKNQNCFDTEEAIVSLVKAEFEKR